MLGFRNVIGIFALISSIKASYNGPFVLWGRDELSHISMKSLSKIDDQFLHDIYSESSAIILFVRNATNHLTEDNFPMFKDLLSKTNYAYLAQQHLGLDPIDFNLNAEVINLVGPTSQQDVELSALYRDAVLTYGDGKVLGILATKTSDHDIQKRAIDDENIGKETSINPATTIMTTNSEPEPNNQTDYVYYPGDQSAYKILLYTSSPPRLFDGKNSTILDNSVKTTITTDRRAANTNSEQRTLKVRYNYKEKLTIEYVFNVSEGYWTLIAADIDWAKSGSSNKTLFLSGDRPTAPTTFSYKCSRPLVFGTNNYYLELPNIQVQLDVGGRRFNDSYDCIGFTSAPIWSGIFIMFIISFSVSIGLTAIMEIKPPNRFENSRGKQLTFTVQE